MFRSSRICTLLLIFLLCILSYHSSCAAGLEYGVMMDAGSTGTRCYIYSWPKRYSSWSIPQVQQAEDVQQQALSMKIEPGISTFASNPSGVKAYLQPLIDFALENIPDDDHASTEIYLFATAGMRLLSEDEQDGILSVVTSSFSSSAFKFGPSQVGIISGAVEGLYAWVAVNFLSDTLGTETTTGALDLGGASTQIAFVVETNERDNTDKSNIYNGVASDQVYQLDFGSKQYRIYSVSFLGFGVNAFMEQREEYLMTQHKNEITIEDPCLLSGYTTSVNASQRIVQFEGSSNGQECLTLTQNLLNIPSQCSCQSKCRCTVDGQHQPIIPDTMTFLGMSSFYYTSSALSDASTVSELAQNAQKFCDKTLQDAQSSSPSSEQKYVWGFCGNGVLASRLLESYDIGDENVHFSQVVGDKEVTWALGAMLVEANLLPVQQKTVWIADPAGAAVFSIMLIIIVFLAAYVAVLRQRLHGNHQGFIELYDQDMDNTHGQEDDNDITKNYALP